MWCLQPRNQAMKEVKGALFPAQLLLGEDFIVWPWQLGQETGPEKRGNSSASLVPEASGLIKVFHRA